MKKISPLEDFGADVLIGRSRSLLLRIFSRMSHTRHASQSRTSSLRSLLRMLAWRNERLSKDPFEGRFWLVDLDTLQMTGTKLDTQPGMWQNAEKNCLQVKIFEPRYFELG